MINRFVIESFQALLTELRYIITFYLFGGTVLGVVGTLLQARGVPNGGILAVILALIIPTHFAIFGVYCRCRRQADSDTMITRELLNGFGGYQKRFDQIVWGAAAYVVGLLHRVGRVWRNDNRRTWWAQRLAFGSSFAEQTTLVLQDFGLVSIILLSAGGLNWLLRFASFAELSKQIIGIVLLCVTVAVVLLFGCELTLLCLHIVRGAIIRERDSFQSAQKRTTAVTPDTAFPHTPDVHPNPALNAFCLVSAAEVQAARKEIESGKFMRDVAEIPKAYGILGDTHSRFDAISCCELAFWHTKRDPFAAEYFNCCSALVGEGKTVTRVFLVSRDEFEQGEDLLYHVLIRHLRAGIGFGVIPYDELPPRCRNLGLDFGLWDLGAAYSHFCQHGEWGRTLYVEFSMNGANPGVAEKVKLFRQMLSYVWLADSTYLSAHATYIHEVRSLWCRNSQHVARRTGRALSIEQVPFLEVCAEADLRQAVTSLFALWKLAQGSVDETRTPVERDRAG